MSCCWGGSGIRFPFCSSDDFRVGVWVRVALLLMIGCWVPPLDLKYLNNEDIVQSRNWLWGISRLEEDILWSSQIRLFTFLQFPWIDLTWLDLTWIDLASSTRTRLGLTFLPAGRGAFWSWPDLTAGGLLPLYYTVRLRRRIYRSERWWPTSFSVAQFSVFRQKKEFIGRSHQDISWSYGIYTSRTVSWPCASFYLFYDSYSSEGKGIELVEW